MDKERAPVNTERPERGPVEELIAKRLRPLNKKVVSNNTTITPPSALIETEVAAAFVVSS